MSAYQLAHSVKQKCFAATEHHHSVYLTHSETRGLCVNKCVLVHHEVLLFVQFVPNMACTWKNVSQKLASFWSFQALQMSF